MTDLAHLTQVLHDTAHREHFSLPALRDWLRTQREERSGATERNRRLDSDAAAVQIMTVWVSKGLQYPDRVPAVRVQPQRPDREAVLFHDGAQRCLHIGGETSPDYAEVTEARPARGRQRRHPAHLCRADPRPVAGGGVVGAVVGRTQRRAVAAAAGPRAR